MLSTFMKNVYKHFFCYSANGHKRKKESGLNKMEKSTHKHIYNHNSDDENVCACAIAIAMRAHTEKNKKSG
jgi:hypothetical protein